MNETTNYMDQAKSFLTRNTSRLALQVVPLALMAVATAHAGFNAPPTSTNATACSGGSVTNYALTGAVKGNGAALTLSGTANFAVFNACTVTLVWKGTGSGTFNGPAATIGANLTITPPSFGYIAGYGLTVLINGATQYSNVCSAQPAFRSASRGFSPRTGIGSCTALSLSPTAINGASVTLSTWEVDLTIVSESDGADSISVSVPASSSIDITGAAVVPVPVLSSAALALTALMLLGLAAFKLVGWKPAEGGFPGRPF